MSAEGQSGYSVVEIGEGALGALNAVAVCAALFPGFLLTVPGIVLALLPVIAAGLLLAVVGLAVAVAAIPLLVGRLVMRRAWRALPSPRVPRVPAIARRIRPAVRRPAL